MGAYQLERSREAPAPAEKIWAQLVEVRRWPEWKRFIRGVAGADQIRGLGDEFQMRIRVKGRLAVPVGVRVCEFAPLRRIAWTGGIRGAVISVHSFILEARGAKTLVTSREEFTGALVGLMQWVVTPGDLIRLHEQWLEAIQRRAESLR